MTLDRLLRPWRGRLTASRHEPWLRAVPSILYMTMIFAISAIPARDLGAAPDDRLMHFLEYGVFGVVLSFSVAGFTGRPLTPLILICIALFGFAFAVSDEWHQSFVPGRDSSTSDVIFDALGLSVSLLLIRVLSKLPERPA